MALTQQQTATLRAAVIAEPSLAQARNTGDDATIAAWLNTEWSPAFWVWRTNVTANETGNAWQGTDIDGMSALNMQRLQLLLASSPSGVFDMSRADRRAGFENPFGTNQNNVSRVAMRIVWKRPAKRAEKILATGTGSNADPAMMTFQGDVSVDEAGLLR